MTDRRLVLLCAMFAAISAATAAAAPRTFVASTGSDANACTIAQPCRSFATAATKTSLEGEIVVLDSGGYGPVSITQPVTITAPSGIYAGITVPTGGHGITVDSVAGRVMLRGLTFVGGGADAIRVHQATVTVDGCVVDGRNTDGIVVHGPADLRIRDTRFNNVVAAVRVFDVANVAIDRIEVSRSSAVEGAVVFTTNTDGTATDLSVSNSVFYEVATAVSVNSGGNSLVNVSASRNTIVSSGFGIAGIANSPSKVVISATDNSISVGGAALQVLGSGVTLFASANRLIAGNRGFDNPDFASTMITLQDNSVAGNVIDVNGTLVSQALR